MCSTDRVEPRQSTAAFGRRFAPESGGDVASRLLIRARKQHREGVTLSRVVHTGLASLDAVVPSWWGLSVISGAPLAGKTALLARLALTTARHGAGVLWIGTHRASETPVLRLLAPIARVPIRNLFVQRQLREDQWAALDAAQRDLASLPIVFVDAHGATPADLMEIVHGAAQNGPLALVAIDDLAEVSCACLLRLEALAEELDVPFVAAAPMPPLARPDDEDPRRALRPGSLLLHVGERDAPAMVPARDRKALRLDVTRVGGDRVVSVAATLVREYRWVEPETEGLA